jgi:L-ascorbate metabolism protein UlaG (beta-lactamase superfamily)
METLGAKLLIPIHWGTFDLSYEPFDEPPKRLIEHARKRGLEQRIKVLQPGESTELVL